MKRILCLLACIFAAAPDVGAADSSQLLVNRAPAQRPSLLIVAMSHLHNPGRDVVNAANADVLTPQRQQQLDEFVRRLAAYRPTHIAIEHPREEQSKIDSQYAAYRAGQYELSRDEQDQIGFRLAKLLGLGKVHAADWNGLPPGERAAYDWDGFAARAGQGEKLKSLIAVAQASVIPLASQDITEWIVDLNRPERLLAAHRFYFDVALFGDDKEQPGAAWVSSWYGRNLRIFRNLATLTDNPDDRVLVIFGQAHAYLLRQFAEESGAFAVRDLAAFAGPAPR